MRLQTYLDENDLKHADFARLLKTRGFDACSEFAVRKWARGERTPRGDAMRRIQEVTNGKVRPADFFDIAPISDASPKRAKAAA